MTLIAHLMTAAYMLSEKGSRPAFCIACCEVLLLKLHTSTTASIACWQDQSQEQ